MNSVVIAVCLMGMVGGCSWLNRQVGLDDDNLIENLLEDVIESHLGLPNNSIDFTPRDDDGEVY